MKTDAHILIVDDDKEIRDLLQEFFQKHGMRVSVARDTLEVVVADDGCGMPRDVRESGLRNLRERAAGHGGELVVESGAGTGTTVTWRVPLG